MSVDTNGVGAAGPHQPGPEIRERAATVLPGVPLACVGGAVAVLGIGLFVNGITMPNSSLVVIGAVLILIAAALILRA